MIKSFFKFALAIFATKFVKPVFFILGALFILGVITFTKLFFLILLEFIIATICFRIQARRDFLKQKDDFFKQKDIEREQAEQERQDLLKRQRIAEERAERARRQAETARRQAVQERKRDEQRREALQKRRALEKQRLIAEVELHRAPLTRNLERAVKKNDYGKILEDNTDKVLYEFLQSFKNQKIDFRDFGYGVRIDANEKRIVLEHLKDLEKKDRESGFDINTLPDNGHEFEHWVAENLNKFGWDAKVTAATGDQGIDVIAKKNSKTIGLQCKLLKSSVGNKAVQEAFTGKTFYQADAVGVMSNAPYTPSAQKIATDTGVKLLSHHDIPNLYDKMFSE